MGVAGVLGQERGHSGRCGAVLHASRALHVGPAPVAQAAAGPHAVGGGHAAPVGQQGLGLRHVAVGQGVLVRHDAAEVEHVGGDGVGFVHRQRLGCIPRHGAVDVVPQRGQRGHLHQRGATGVGSVGQPRHAPAAHVGRGGAAHQRREHRIALAEDAVAGLAFRLPHHHALSDRARAGGQALEVRPHVDVPGGDFGRQGGAADAGEGRRRRVPGLGGGGGRSQAQHSHRQEDPQAVSRDGHCRPPRFPAPARSAPRCCDRSTARRVPRAIGGWWAARSRCCRWRGSG